MLSRTELFPDNLSLPYNTYVILMRFLDEKSKLMLGAVSKTQRQALRQSATTPFASKSEFTLEVSGLFRKKDFYNAAWDNYQRAFNCQEALLYKMRDGDIKERILATFSSDLEMQVSGKVYSPGVYHDWPVNQAWLLGQLHAGHPFIVLSQLRPEFIKRKHDRKSYSAFVKELAVLLKFSYSISIDLEGRIRLTPDSYPLHRLSLKDIELDDSSIEKAILQINNAQESNMMAIEGVIILKRKLSLLSAYKAFELLNLREKILVELGQLITNIFFVSKDKKVALQSLARIVNVSLAAYGITVQLDTGLQLFNTSSADRIKQQILVSCCKYIDRLADQKMQSRSCCVK